MSRIVLTLKTTMRIAATTVALLLLVEYCAWLVLQNMNPAPQASERWEEYTPDTGWRMKPNFRGTIVGVRRSTNEQGLPRNTTLASAGKTVLILGDSVSFGYGVEEEFTYGALLQEGIEDLRVVNLATPGYTSYQGLQRLEQEGDSYRPDLLIAGFGFNDRRVVRSAREQDSRQKFARYDRAIRWRARVNAISTIALMQRLRGSAIGTVPHAAREITGLDTTLGQLPVRVSPGDYAANLRKIAEWAAARDIPVIFLLNGDAPRSTRYFEFGEQAVARGDWENAYALYSAAADTHPFFELLLREQAARMLEGLSRHEEAREMRTIQTLTMTYHGGALGYRDAVYQELLRNPPDTPGVELLDTTGILDSETDSYLDFCHWTAQGHARVADKLIPIIQQRLALRPRD